MLDIELLSPERRVSQSQFHQVSVPSALGAIGILPGHAPLVAKLGTGKLAFLDQDATEKETYFIAGGFLEVSSDRVRILVDVVERPEEIDRKRAEDARARAEKRLASLDRSADIDVPRAQAALQRALFRLKVSAP